jgi:hypothetical protein
MLEVREVEGWAEGLEQLHTRIAARFARSEQRGRVPAYLKGLPSPSHAKMAGNWLNKQVKRTQMAYNAC